MQFIALINHLINAGNEHKLHSPFLFKFYCQVSKEMPDAVLIDKIERLRKLLKKNSKKINITDFGAGSKWKKTNYRSIKGIASSSEKEKKWQFLLYSIVKNYFNKSHIIELGTSFGLTSAYLAKASSTNFVTTFEGCPEIAKIATENHRELAVQNSKIITGNIDETLLQFLETIKNVDFVLFDANHRYEPTLRYFEQCLAKATNESIFVFDDIYWSSEMQRAWEEIKKHPSVSVTLDFYQIGIVFFRKELSKQHFKLKI